MAYQLNFGRKSKNIMLMEIVAYSLIAFQVPLVFCRPQSQNFNGSNPYYDSYIQNQYWDKNGNLDPHSTTQKPLYPTLYPQIPNTTPQPYYAKGQYTPSAPSPQSNYFSGNSSYQYPPNNYGTNNLTSFGWNSNFDPHTTPPPAYQPYGQFNTSTAKFPVTTLPPFYPTGPFNRYNQTNPASNSTRAKYPSYPHNSYPINPTYPPPNTFPPNVPSSNSNFHPHNPNKTAPTYPSYDHNNNYPSNPTYPPYRPSSSFPPNTPSTNSFSNYQPHNPNGTAPTYPSYHRNNSYPSNPTYPPYRPPSTPPTFSNYRPPSNFPSNPSYPASNRTNPTHPSYNPYNSSRTNPTKTNHFPNINQNSNMYSPQYQPSAPSVMPIQPNYDQNGTPLATFATFHANQPIDDYLFNYDNLHRRQPNNGMQSGQFEQLNRVPLAPFPGQKQPTYDSVSNVPLAPFPG